MAKVVDVRESEGIRATIRLGSLLDCDNSDNQSLTLTERIWWTIIVMSNLLSLCINVSGHFDELVKNWITKNGKWIIKLMSTVF